MVLSVISARALVLDEPLSFWGGINPGTGEVVDHRHPQLGAIVSDQVLVMPSGRGSSSSSSVLLESIRLGTAPAAIVVKIADPILVLSSIVADELYSRCLPVVTVPPSVYASIKTGSHVHIEIEKGAPRVSVISDR